MYCTPWNWLLHLTEYIQWVQYYFFPHSNKKAGTVVLEFCKNCIANIKYYTATRLHLNCAPFPLRAWLWGQEGWRLAIWELNKRKTKHILNSTGVRNLVLSWPIELLYNKHIISHANVQHIKDLLHEVHKIWGLLTNWSYMYVYTHILSISHIIYVEFIYNKLKEN